jgi:splicing factor 3B subunit 3
LVEIKKEKLDYEITALELGQIEEGRQRCSFMAIGLSDHTVRLVTVDPENCLDIVSTQALPSLAESLCMMEMINQDYGQELSMLSTT